MSAARHDPPMTLQEFLAWEERQEQRFEFDGWQPVAMAGGTVAHETVQVNLVAALHTRLRGTPCRAYGNSLKIEVAGRIRYPDAFVACVPIGPRETVHRVPVVVFEILSPGTEATDRGAKMHEYWATPSIASYVTLDQDSVLATVHRRDQGRWLGRVLWAGDTIDLPEVGIALPLDELYAGLTFEAAGITPSPE